MNSKRIRLWDLPTRLCHWLLAASVAAALVTGQIGGHLIDWHGRLGLLIVGLVVFRIVWGFVGSTYARFAQFFPRPARIVAYLAGAWRGEGHNPLGALSVFALIFLLLAQVATGLFASDDIAFTGPLYTLASNTLSERLTRLHHLLADGLIVLVLLHIAAIVFYLHGKKQNLVKPMLTGWKEDAGGEAESARGGGWLALVFAVAVAGLAVYAAAGVWLPEAAPPTAAETPNW